MDKKFLLRKSTGDSALAAGSELPGLILKGQCKPSDFLFDYELGQWFRLGDHPAMAELFAAKLATPPERRLIYVLSIASSTSIAGPYSTTEIRQRMDLREFCDSSWVFVEGDKEWRQIKNVKILHEMLPPLPVEAPPPPAAESVEPAASEPMESPKLVQEDPSSPSIKLDLGAFGGETNGSSGPTSSPPISAEEPQVPPSAPAEVEREDVTLAFDTMGLNLHSESAIPPPKPSSSPKPQKPPMPPQAPPGLVMDTAVKSNLTLETNPAISKPPSNEAEGFDGITAEIPTDPVWLIKQASGETVSGPFRFLDVVKFLEQGRLTKNDKVAKTGTKAFVKISQQYEFNVKYSLETVVEKGQEKQKILIRRRHPRVPYITGVQVVSRHGLLAGQCMNISAGGILMEVPKAEFNLGEIIEVKILPGLISKAISCKALIIGKIPKIPPGYALKFEDLKKEDKEAIEFFVQESLKREMSKKN